MIPSQKKNAALAGVPGRAAFGVSVCWKRAYVFFEEEKDIASEGLRQSLGGDGTDDGKTSLLAS